MIRILLFLFISLSWMFPAPCCADAIAPLTNMFTPDTMVSSTIVMVVIILIEAFLLNKWVKEVRFKVCLWRSFLANMASSAAGSVVLNLYQMADPVRYQLLNTFSLLLPMFLLTLLVETPILAYLFRREVKSWFRIIQVSFGINLFSYLAFIVIEAVMIFGTFWFGGLEDRLNAWEWSDKWVLNGQSGSIYMFESEGMKSNIKEYNWKTGIWNILKEIHLEVSNQSWDIQGNLLAGYISKTGKWDEKEPLTLWDLDTSKMNCQLKGNFTCVSISPDRKYLAASEYKHWAAVRKDDKTVYVLGDTCVLAIYDTRTGVIEKKVPRMALSEGLAWSNDSKTLYFPSLQDETWFEKSPEDYKASSTQGRSYTKKNKYPINIYSFDLSSSTVKPVAQGLYPWVVSMTGDLCFLRENALYDNQIWSKNLQTDQEKLLFDHYPNSEFALSPDGHRLLLALPKYAAMGEQSFLAVVDADHTDKRAIIDPVIFFGFKWTK